MPYKSEKIKLKGLQDRRKRLTDKQRKEIEEIYISAMDFDAMDKKIEELYKFFEL